MRDENWPALAAAWGTRTAEQIADIARMNKGNPRGIAVAYAAADFARKAWRCALNAETDINARIDEKRYPVPRAWKGAADEYLKVEAEAMRELDARIDELRYEVLKRWIEKGYRVFSELDTHEVRLAPPRYRTYSDWLEATSNHKSD